MKERPLLFSAPMVLATLADIKWHTRRVVKEHKPSYINGHKPAPKDLSIWNARPSFAFRNTCPYGQVGDQLWVRETHAIVPRTAYAQSEGVDQVNKPNDNHDAAVFKAGWVRSRPARWRPSIHMPRWASRIQLEITSVRIEALHDISYDDAIAEGWSPKAEDGKSPNSLDPKTWYRNLWEQINGAGSWDLNPLVWVIEFKRIK